MALVILWSKSQMLKFDQFEVLTFDCYGTLIDWESGILAALRPILESHRVNVSCEKMLALYAEFEARVQSANYLPYRQVLRQVMREFGARFNFSPSESEVKALEESLPQWQPFSDTVGALRLLKSKFKLAIISNIDDDLFQQTERRLQVPFDFVITAQQVGSYKPSLNNFNAAIARIGISKDCILHLAGSLYHDIAPAKQLGLSTVWIQSPTPI